MNYSIATRLKEMLSTAGASAHAPYGNSLLAE
jgi:hypothetical protein